MKFNTRAKKGLGLTYKTMNGDRITVTDAEAQKSVLLALLRANNYLTTREIGEKVLSDAYFLSVTLGFIGRILEELYRKELIRSKKKTLYPTPKSQKVWCWSLTKRGKTRARRYQKQEGTP